MNGILIRVQVSFRMITGHVKVQKQKIKIDETQKNVP